MKLYQHRSIVYQAGDAKTQKPPNPREVLLVVETTAWGEGSSKGSHVHLVIVLSLPLARKVQRLLRRSARRQELRALAASSRAARAKSLDEAAKSKAGRSKSGATAKKSDRRLRRAK
jgi:hypothetical protein